MKDSRLFSKYFQNATGDDIAKHVLWEALHIREQLGDKRGDWIPVTCPNKPVGVEAIYRDTSELTEYMYLRYPADEKGDWKYEGYLLNVNTDPATVLRWETAVLSPMVKEIFQY